MPTTPDQEAADARWAAAADLAVNSEDAGMKKRRTRVWFVVVGVLLGSMVLGALVAVLTFDGGSDSAPSSGPSDAQVTIQLVLTALGFLVGILGFIWAVRRGYYITRWRSIASPLNRRERRSVRREIAGKETGPTDHLPIVVAIAKQNRKAILGAIPLYAAIVLFAIATIVVATQVLIVVLEGVVILMFAAVAVQLCVSYRQVGRFIAQNRHVPVVSAVPE